MKSDKDKIKDIRLCLASTECCGLISQAPDDEKKNAHYNLKTYKWEECKVVKYIFFKPYRVMYAKSKRKK